MTTPEDQPLTDQDIDAFLEAMKAEVTEWASRDGLHSEDLIISALTLTSQARAYQDSAALHATQAACHARRARSYAIAASILATIAVFFAIYSILT
jgi:hypothetical protein